MTDFDTSSMNASDDYSIYIDSSYFGKMEDLDWEEAERNSATAYLGQGNDLHGKAFNEKIPPTFDGVSKSFFTYDEQVRDGLLICKTRRHKY